MPIVNAAGVWIETMASGHLALILRQDAGWAGLDEFATLFGREFNGKILERHDTPVERVWLLQFGATEVWLAYDDAFDRYELNSRDADGDTLIRTLKASLEAQGAWAPWNPDIGFPEAMPQPALGAEGAGTPPRAPCVFGFQQVRSAPSHTRSPWQRRIESPARCSGAPIPFYG